MTLAVSKLYSGLENLTPDRKATAILLRKEMELKIQREASLYPELGEFSPYYAAQSKAKTITAQKAIVEAKQTTLAQEVFGPIWKFLNQKIF
jgi:hypothetical protein